MLLHLEIHGTSECTRMDRCIVLEQTKPVLQQHVGSDTPEKV